MPTIDFCFHFYSAPMTYPKHAQPEQSLESCDMGFQGLRCHIRIRNRTDGTIAYI